MKSSVLFLKKHTERETKRMRDIKQNLKDSISAEHRLEPRLAALERQKKAALKTLAERPEFAELTKAELKENEAYQDAAKGVAEEFSAKVEEVRFELTELYEERRRKELPDYPIFMAIAEDIGYDATGRPTTTNELEPIAAELACFIHVVEEGEA